MAIIKKIMGCWRTDPSAGNLWTYEEKFNNFTNGEINGQGGWSYLNGSGAVIQTTNSPYPDPTSVKHVYLPTCTIRKTLGSAVVSGTFYFSMKVATPGYCFFKLRPGDENAILLGFDSTYSSYIRVVDGHGFLSLVPYSVDTYYRFGIKFECGAGGWEGLAADTYKMNINGGSWYGPYSFYDAATSLDTIDFYSEGGVYGNGWADYISPNYEPYKIIKKIAGVPIP